jgi:hypothetical protein
MPSESAELGVEIVAEGIDHEAQAGLPADQSSSKNTQKTADTRGCLASAEQTAKKCSWFRQVQKVCSLEFSSRG